MEKAMTVRELSETFGVSYNQCIIICKIKGSPAYKSGVGRTSPWLCMPSKFEEFMQKNAEKWKG